MHSIQYNTCVVNGIFLSFIIHCYVYKNLLRGPQIDDKDAFVAQKSEPVSSTINVEGDTPTLLLSTLLV